MPVTPSPLIIWGYRAQAAVPLMVPQGSRSYPCALQREALPDRVVPVGSRSEVPAIRRQCTLARHQIPPHLALLAKQQSPECSQGTVSRTIYCSGRILLQVNMTRELQTRCPATLM